MCAQDDLEEMSVLYDLWQFFFSLFNPVGEERKNKQNPKQNEKRKTPTIRSGRANRFKAPPLVSVPVARF